MSFSQSYMKLSKSGASYLTKENGCVYVLKKEK
jgi:hypothetical protein